MNVHRIGQPRGLGLAVGAAAALAVGLVAAGPAGATRSSSAQVANDTLTVTGRPGSDSIALRLAPGAPGTLQVDLNDDGSPEQSFDRSTFSRIDVFMRSSDDRFRIDQVNGSFTDENVTVDGGSGDDTIDGGDGAELLLGASGRDVIDGNRGNDTAALGAGRDTFRWDPGDGSDVVEGQRGGDTLDFNGAGADETMSLSPNGSRSLFLRDVGNVRMDMDDVERLDLAALGGADSLTIEDMSGTDMRQADVDLSGPTGGGDGQADVVTVKGTARADRIDVEADGALVDVEGLPTEARIAGADATDQLRVESLAGDDDVDVDADALALMGVIVDLGTGQR